jgi:multiple sugar transport system substrate-binding protein
MNNTDNTFVTPVFNGSASLRNAAGQLIENVTKSVRRGENVNLFYFRNLYSDVTSLYRLDQIATESTIQELGPLPNDAVWLLVGLGTCCVAIGVYAVYSALKKKKKML